MAEPYVLEVEDLIKTYPKFLLDKVSFALPLGRVMGFVGQNGEVECYRRCLFSFL